MGTESTSSQLLSRIDEITQKYLGDGITATKMSIDIMNLVYEQRAAARDEFHRAITGIIAPAPSPSTTQPQGK